MNETSAKLIALIAEKLSLADAATEGPWFEMPDPYDAGIKAEHGTLVAGLGPTGSNAEFLANRKFIAQSRTDMPNVLLALKEATEALESLSEDVDYGGDVQVVISKCLALVEGRSEP